MPKNKGKGGKNRRRGKNENEGAKRELILKEEGQERFNTILGLGPILMSDNFTAIIYPLHAIRIETNL